MHLNGLIEGEVWAKDSAIDITETPIRENLFQLRPHTYHMTGVIDMREKSIYSGLELELSVWQRSVELVVHEHQI